MCEDVKVSRNMCKVTSCCLEVIVRNYPRYKHFDSDANVKNHLSKCCKDIIIYSLLSSKSTIDLSNNKLARIHGISYLIVRSIGIQKNSFNGVVCKSTKLRIQSVHSDDYHRCYLEALRVRRLGGLDSEMKKVLQLMHLNRLATNLLHRPLGVIIHGPPGCGKTSFGRKVAAESGSILFKVDNSDVVKSELGAGPEALKKLFNKAVDLLDEGSVIIFLDDIDILCPRQENSSMGTKQMASALMSEMDSLQRKNTTGLLVMSTTSAISSIDPLLRRPGRFDHEILINVPNELQRTAILDVLTCDHQLATDVCCAQLARITPGFVGADLQQLCEETFNEAFSNRADDDNTERVSLKLSDFESALHRVIPSLKKSSECIVDLQTVRWDEIGGLDEVKAQVKQSVEWPLLFPEALSAMDISPTRGLLLYGPPGCCKTTLVRAAATSSSVSLLSLNGAQIYSPYVGESERIISEAFQKARALAPSILFFDEIESLVGKRTCGSGQSRVQERILSTLLNEMDGVGTRLDHKMTHSASVQEEDNQKMIGTKTETKSTVDGTERLEDTSSKGRLNSAMGVMLVGATNRADMLDAAILRPGRLDRHIYVPPPDSQARAAILKIYASKMPSHADLDLDALSLLTELYTGADLKNLCREAGLVALREQNLQAGFPDVVQVKHTHFIQALHSVKASLSQEMLKQYNYNEKKK